MNFWTCCRKFVENERVKAAVFDYLRKHPKVKFENLAEKTNLKTLGLNSLDIIEFIVDIEEDLRVNLMEDEVVSIFTCEDAISAFTRHAEKRVT